MKKQFKALSFEEMMNTNGGESNSWCQKIFDGIAKIGSWLWS